MRHTAHENGRDTLSCWGAPNHIWHWEVERVGDFLNEHLIRAYNTDRPVPPEILSLCERLEQTRQADRTVSV